VLAAGRAAVPLDADHPDLRNQLIAAHAGAVAVVSAGVFAERARSLFPANLAVLDCDAIETGPPIELRRPGPRDPAYIIYTSGSSGAPKGVCHDHRNGLHDTLLQTSIGHVGPADRVSMVYSGVVIGGIRNVFVALLNGAALDILPPQALGAAGLARELRSRGVTIYLSVPTLFRRIAAAVAPDERIESVRIARFGGERIEWSDVDASRRVFSPEVHVHAAVGSTECSSTYAQWFVDDRQHAAGDRLPVGRPLPNVAVKVLDEDGREVPDGEVGEFVVSSPYLALGYWREPELTARAFSNDPSDPEVRIFRTGDVGLRRADGLLEIVGRKDQLIKLRGHRIELSEIERALRTCPGVADAGVVVRRHGSGAVKSLVAYVELDSDSDGLLPRHLQFMAGRVLPSYMRPSAIFVVDALPRLAVHKIDRPELARLDAAKAGRAEDRASDPLMDKVAGVFERALDCAGVTPEDNLLSLGGDSLLAVDVVAELERSLDLTVPFEVFQQSQSIRDLTAWISSRLGARAERQGARAGR